MKIAFVTLPLLALVLASGCSDSSPNQNSQTDVATEDQRLSISVPWTVHMKQGEVRSTTVTLSRSPFFKQDVVMTFQAEGIVVTPAKATVKASDKPEVALQVEVAMNAAIGDYRVHVTGLPENGVSVQAEFLVRVTAP